MPHLTHWECLETTGERLESPEGAEMDHVSLCFKSDGKIYVVSVTGPAGMSNHDLMNACRATAGVFIRASGGDPAQVTGVLADPQPAGTIQ